MLYGVGVLACVWLCYKNVWMDDAFNWNGFRNERESIFQLKMTFDDFWLKTLRFEYGLNFSGGFDFTSEDGNSTRFVSAFSEEKLLWTAFVNKSCLFYTMFSAINSHYILYSRFVDLFSFPYGGMNRWTIAKQ